MKIKKRLLACFAAAGLGASAVFCAGSVNAAARGVQTIHDAGGQLQEKVLSQAIDEMLSAGSYSEGEAIAVVRGSARPAISGEAELLLHSGRDAVNGAIESGKKNGSLSADLARQRMAEGEGDDFSIWMVREPGKTTGELLHALYADSDVISAEPDYRVYAEKTTPEVQMTSGVEDSPAEEQTAPKVQMTSGVEDTPNDLSAMQWDLADTSDIYTTPLSPTGGYSLGVPGWKEGHGDKNAPANASGTICIMDTGIDTDHPDLKGVLYEFTKEQQSKYGCGRYGYNASGDERPVTEQKAVAAHGTHVAGIIAAEWNGEGVSGIAHGAKIFSVNVFGGLGSTQVMESVLKGFGFLIDVAQEVNLKAVNCSWGTVQPQFAFSTAIEELGKKGVNTVIASGNRYLDLDESIDLGSQTHSEYAVVVNASSPDGKMTDFSCWGQDSTDVFAPGGSILSTMPQIIQLGEGKDINGYADNTRFYPEASPEESLLSIIGIAGSEEESEPTEDDASEEEDQQPVAEDDASEEETHQPVTGIERFATDVPGVLFFDANPAMDQKARRIGEINEQNGFDDKRSTALRLADLPKEQQKEHGGFSAVNGYVYMAIPVTSAGDARWISVKTAMSDGFKPNGGIDSITCSDADGKPVEIDSACAPALKKGCESGAFYPFYQCQWSVLSCNIQGYIEASNETHDLLGREMSEEERNELLGKGLWDYRDPGEIKGIYEWDNGGQKYVIARIGMGMSDGEARQTEAAQQTTLFVDNVAVGDKSAFAGSYAIMSGTSMAAPAVTGCLAVIAANEPQSASMTDEQLAEAARERAAKLMASVDYDDELAHLCRTGGRVNLHGKTEFTAKAPLISKVEAQQTGASAADGSGALQQNVSGAEAQQRDSVMVEGWYFGPQGTITVDDREVEVLAWEDGKIRADINGIPNGSHVVRVTNADGAVSRAVFSTSSESAQGRRLFENTHSLPLREQAFMEDHCDRIYDSITGCGGKIYAFAVSAKYRAVQGIWSYSIDEDKWAPCALPENFDTDISCGANQLASLRDRLYLYGSEDIPSEDGGIGDEPCLWRYEPYGDFWEKLDIDMPKASAGICALGDTLFAVGGYLPEEESEVEEEMFVQESGEGLTDGADAVSDSSEGVADDEDSAPDRSEEQPDDSLKFFRIDLAGASVAEVSSDIGSSYEYVYGKIATSRSKLYIYLQYGYDAEEEVKDLTAKGKLFRASYDASQNRIVSEDLTDTLEKALGPDLRTAYDKLNVGDEPAEHFAITGIADGLAVIGSGTPGEDVHVIYDDENEAVLYDKASSYHKAFDPLAVYYGGRLYVIGYNTTEPDVMYFRSDPVESRMQNLTSPEEAAKRTRYIGIATIALIAGTLILLGFLRKGKREL